MKNFIKTTDKETADKLLACGFQLISQVGNTYTFLNQPPKNFNFDTVENENMELFSHNLDILVKSYLDIYKIKME